MKLQGIVIGIFSGCLLTGADAARADTPQLAVGRMSAAYNHLDLTNYMAAYARSYTLTDVTGKRYGYLRVQSSAAKRFASRTHPSLQCRLISTATQGKTAQSRLMEHYVWQQSRYTPGYVFTRDVTLNVLWTQGPLGWQMASAQMSRDVSTYQRL